MGRWCNWSYRYIHFKISWTQCIFFNFDDLPEGQLCQLCDVLFLDCDKCIHIHATIQFSVFLYKFSEYINRIHCTYIYTEGENLSTMLVIYILHKISTEWNLHNTLKTLQNFHSNYIKPQHIFTQQMEKFEDFLDVWEKKSFQTKHTIWKYL